MAASELTGYLFKPQAEDDLAAIWRYSAETWSVDQADFYIGKTDPDDRNPGRHADTRTSARRVQPAPMRIHPVAEHLIIYSIEGDRLVVVRILGSRRNWRALLGVIDG